MRRLSLSAPIGHARRLRTFTLVNDVAGVVLPIGHARRLRAFRLGDAVAGGVLPIGHARRLRTFRLVDAVVAGMSFPTDGATRGFHLDGTFLSMMKILSDCSLFCYDYIPPERFKIGYIG